MDFNAKLDSILDEKVKRSKLGPPQTKRQQIPPVHSNLKRQRVPLSDDIQEEEDMVSLDPGGEPEPDDGDADVSVDELSGEGDSGGPVSGTPSGSNFTLQQAKGQLDGIIKQWMLLSGEYPEGEQRRKFLELGMRLREISGVVERDFINKDKPSAEPEP